MAVGDRIKRARNLRGMTQKELGIAIGFEEKSADIRIAQYESNTRTPKEELLRKIAEVLDCDAGDIVSFIKEPITDNDTSQPA